MKNLLFIPLAIALFFPVRAKAQCPVITCPSTLSLPCSNTGNGAKITATSNYSANIRSRWINSAGIELVSYGTSTSTAFLNYAGTYTVEFKDLSSSCVSTKTVLATNTNAAPPLFGIISSSNFSSSCTAPCPVNVYNGQSQVGGNITYAFGRVGSTPAFGPGSTFSAPGCGHYYVMLKDLSNNCISSYFVNIKCNPGPAPSITISSTPNPLCIGETSTLTASGVSAYTWTTGVTDPTIAVTPTVAGTVYLVGGQDNDGCGTSAIIQAVSCSTVNNSIYSATAESAGYHIFPNPASTRLSIESQKVQQAKTGYLLSDLGGRNILEGSFDQNLELDLSTLSAGSYLLRFNDAAGSWYKKIIIAH